MIKCDLRPVGEYGSIVTENKKKKFGKYHGSMFWDVPNFGSKKWVVGVRIDIGEYIDLDMEDEEVVMRCIDYINSPPPRKKFERRKRKPKFGQFEVHSAKVHRTALGNYISALLITESRNSKHFWGKGIVI